MEISSQISEENDPKLDQTALVVIRRCDLAEQLATALMSEHPQFSSESDDEFEFDDSDSSQEGKEF